MVAVGLALEVGGGGGGACWAWVWAGGVGHGPWATFVGAGCAGDTATGAATAWATVAGAVAASRTNERPAVSGSTVYSRPRWSNTCILAWIARLSVMDSTFAPVSYSSVMNTVSSAFSYCRGWTLRVNPTVTLLAAGASGVATATD
jgi:hypothetical protein